MLFLNNPRAPTPEIVANSPAETSLLDLKLMLVAVRLVHSPAAIILDEPDWGFSHRTAIAFVAAAIESAHSLGVAVLLISHKPWWQRVAPSVLRVVKKLPPRSAENPLFRIHVKAEFP